MIWAFLVAMQIQEIRYSGVGEENREVIFQGCALRKTATDDDDANTPQDRVNFCELPTREVSRYLGIPRISGYFCSLKHIPRMRTT